jgi:hypothetical protein
MNHREPLPAPGGAGQVWHVVVLLLLPAMAAAPAGSEAYFPMEALPVRRPSYLAIVGPPPLRFQEALPPPDPAIARLSGPPPPPAVPADERASSSEKVSAITAPPLSPAANPSTPAPSPASPPASAQPPPVTPPAAPSILPDEMRTNTRPEDFLPFFQLPGAAPQTGDATASAPTPGKLPPSAATYTQK